MTFPSPRTALEGNPPTPGYSPRKQDLVNVLEQMQTIAAVQVLKDFHGAVADLPDEGNENGDKRAVLASDGDGGGVYRWSGSAWELVAALPVVLTQSVSAVLAQAWAEAETPPGGNGTRSARSWSIIAGNNSRLQMGTTVTAEPGAPADATIVGPPGEQLLNLLIPRGTNGWSPVITLVSDGERRVLQLTSWVSGEGTPPEQLGFFGASGLVETAAEALDIRGPVGSVGNATSDDLSNASTVDGSSVSDALNALHIAKLPRTAPTGSAVLPVGTTAERDADPAAGYSRFNSTTGRKEIHDGNGWSSPVKLAGDTLEGGYTIGAPNDGTQSSGTYTPNPATGNLRLIANGGDFTFAAPTASGDFTMIVHMTNNAEAGAATFTGFDLIDGDDLTDEDGDAFRIQITKLGGVVDASVRALQ